MHSETCDVVILTGAGISAESGIKTFRDADGLWEGYQVQDVATPEAFEKNPSLVYKFYNKRREQLLGGEVHPNQAHIALAKLEDALKERLLVITQNVDNLHERAGSKNIIHMHGELTSVWCRECNERIPWEEDNDDTTICPSCGVAGKVRPDIVWFGEMPYHMERIDQAVSSCKTFVSIGTSGNVYPAAGLVRSARVAGAETIEINLDESMQSSVFHDSRLGKAGSLVPEWVEEYLGSS